MIYLRPTAGTCNRLRAIAAALSLSKACDDELCVYWVADSGMNEKFTNLFEDNGSFTLIENPSDELNARFTADNEWSFEQSDFSDLKKVEAVCEKILKSRPKGQDVFISTLSHFYGNHDYSWLAFSSHVQEMAAEYLCQFGSNCIGVHVRRTDNVKSCAYSPVTMFIDTIKDEIDKDKQARFFLATDSEVVRQILMLRFGNRIITRKGISARFDPQGIIDGVVDLMLLVRTKKIYGSYWSSFSQEAARIGKIPCSILRESWQDPLKKVAELNDMISNVMLAQMQCEKIIGAGSLS